MESNESLRGRHVQQIFLLGPESDKRHVPESLGEDEQDLCKDGEATKDI